MIAVLLVTHNSEDFITDTLTSITNQSQQPDIKIAVDDHSTDETQKLLLRHGFTVIKSHSTSGDTTTRIAQNFVQGVNAAKEAGAMTVILGDHDDTWHPDRIKHQVSELTNHPRTAFLASDGKVTDTTTLRSTFPVPSDFNDRDQNAQWKYTAKHSIATGGASALVPSNFTTLEVPEGWLHDRWWSLRAVHERSMRVDPTIVIDYRITGTQQVGLNTRGQRNPVTRLIHQTTTIPLTLKKMRDISALLSERGFH